MKDYPPYLDYPKERKPQTNYDRLISKTPEELAKFLFHRGNGQEYCYGICVRQDDCDGQDDDRICIDSIVKWLKSPVEVDK